MIDGYEDPDWINWEFVPLKPEWLNKSIMDKCRREGIPTKILRIKRKDGKEELMILKKSQLQIQLDLSYYYHPSIASYMAIS